MILVTEAIMLLDFVLHFGAYKAESLFDGGYSLATTQVNEVLCLCTHN